MKITFIGTGNMGSALIGGIIAKGTADPSDIVGADPSEQRRQELADKFGIRTVADNREAIDGAEIIFLAVKPQIAANVIADIRGDVKNEQLIISIVAGKTIDWYNKQFGRKIRIIRTMPNTPALVGEGMMAICAGDLIGDWEIKAATYLLESVGKVQIVTENLMDAVVAVSGSSPAYVFIMIEAMADAAVAEGMPRSQAYQFAAQSVLGSAKLVLESGKHPGELKDMVCSPAGTTIAAVRELEKRGFRSAIIEAMAACAEVNRNL